MPDMDKYISTSQAAELAGLTADYIRDLCRDNRVKSQKFGHVVMVDKDSLLKHVANVREWREQRAGETDAQPK
jgi:excisionase family DNA binding protein